MARPPRFQPAGGIFHVGARGNLRAAIYFDDLDRRRFLSLLDRVSRRYGWDCRLYCLLPNHFHLVVETATATLSRGMHALNGTYARRFNERHGREGHLFEKRFWSDPIEDDRRLVRTLEYVAQNPVRAGLCKRPEQWPWTGGSSFFAMASCLARGHGVQGHGMGPPGFEPGTNGL